MLTVAMCIWIGRWNKYEVRSMKYEVRTFIQLKIYK